MSALHQALRPCPFCGMSVATVSNTDELGHKDSSFMHTVVCDAHHGGCGSAVGYEIQEAAAIATWNRHPDPSAEVDGLRADAARYRWLKGRLDSVDFAYGEPARTVLAFSMPDGCRFSANLDATLDAAMAGEPK